jgi:hypothetical protein
MSSEIAACCPRCQAALEPDSLFCTSCGLRLAQAGITPPAPSAPALDGSCVHCGAALEPSSVFCTTCGAKAETGPDPAPAPVNVAAGKPAAASAPDRTVAVASGSSAPTSAAAAELAPAMKPFQPGPELQAPRRNAPILLLLLFLAIGLGIAAFMFNRPKSARVLILTPESSSVAVAAGSTAMLGVGVEGSTDDLVWTVEEKNSGRLEPAGVTVQGSRLIYHALYHAPLRAGSYHITAASRENKDQAATIRVDVGSK